MTHEALAKPPFHAVGTEPDPPDIMANARFLNGGTTSVSSAGGFARASHIRTGLFRWTAALCFCLTHALSAQVDVAVEGALLTHYVDRGELVVDDPVFQSQLELSGGGWSFDVWGNLELTDENDRLLEVTEVELTLAYAVTLDNLNVQVGLRQYLFPEEPATREVILHAMMLTPFNPAVGIYYDFDLIDGIYIDIGGHHDVSLSASLSLDLRASLGYADAAANQDTFGFNRGALRDLNLGATLSYAIDQSADLSLGGNYWRLVDTDLRRTVADDDGVYWEAAFQRRF